MDGSVFLHFSHHTQPKVQLRVVAFHILVGGSSDKRNVLHKSIFYLLFIIDLAGHAL